MTRKRLRAHSLKVLIEELEGVESELPNPYGLYSEDGVEYEEPGKIESTEVEIALQSVISIMTKECSLEEEPESFSDLMSQLFSPEDDLVGMSSNLEDAINGYFGELFGEDLESASEYLNDIIKELKERIDKWTKRRRSPQSSKPE